MQKQDLIILNTISKDKDEGFTLLVKTYTETVYWHIRRLIGAFTETEDITQETFLRIYRSLETFRADCTLRTWLLRIATNEALRYLERVNRQKGILAEGTEELDHMLAEEYIDYNDLEVVALQKAIDNLPPKQRAVFNLRYYDELSFEEIAAILETSPSSAKASYHVAKEKIKDILTR